MIDRLHAPIIVAHRQVGQHREKPMLGVAYLRQSALAGYRVRVRRENLTAARSCADAHIVSKAGSGCVWIAGGIPTYVGTVVHDGNREAGGRTRGVGDNVGRDQIVLEYGKVPIKGV